MASEARDRAGFSLLELLIAMLLVSLTATASIWVYFSRAEITLDNATRLLIQDLRAAQSRAILLRSQVSIEFTADGGGYTSIGPGGEVVTLDGNRSPIVRSYDKDGVFEGVRIRCVDLGPGRFVAFDEHGNATKGGKIQVCYRNETRTLEIDGGSGAIKVLGPNQRLEDEQHR